MNKLNTKLLSIFLVVGIIFFLVIIFMFITKEIVPSNPTKANRIKITEARIIKNDYVNHNLLDSIKHAGEAMEHSIYRSYVNQQGCNILIINTNDSNIYAKSNDFKLELIDPPQTVEFNSNSIIPHYALKDDFKLVIEFKDKKRIEFPIGTFHESLNLKSKNNYFTEPREFKLVSTDNKIVLFLVLMIE